MTPRMARYAGGHQKSLPGRRAVGTALGAGFWAIPFAFRRCGTCAGWRSIPRSRSSSAMKIHSAGGRRRQARVQCGRRQPQPELCPATDALRLAPLSPPRTGDRPALGRQFSSSGKPLQRGDGTGETGRSPRRSPAARALRRRVAACEVPRRSVSGIAPASAVGNGLYLFDEPEVALSPQRQLPNLFRGEEIAAGHADHHSRFFPRGADALTQLAGPEVLRHLARLRSHAPGQGEVERDHQFWQKRLPALFAAEGISGFAPAHALLDPLRHHHNAHENTAHWA